MFGFFYRVCIGILVRILPLVALFSKKVKFFLDSRKRESKLFKDFIRPEGNLYWYHCASLGEYEQAKPLIKALQERDNAFSLITFFSPSGYEIIKPKQADNEYITYLPLEQKMELNGFIKKVQPTKVFWVKYELWWQALTQIFNLKVPTYLVSASFSSNHFVTQFWGKPWRSLLTKFTAIFVQNKSSFDVLEQIDILSNITGDTRFDNVAEIAAQGYENQKLTKWKGNAFLLVAGSSWQEEEKICISFLAKEKGAKAIIAPHDISEKHIFEIEKALKEHHIKYALWQDSYEADCQVIILNTIGELSKVYKYANLAFVGGGFRKGLHNVLEPLAWGVPVATGPNIQNYWEGVEAEKEGVLSMVSSNSDFDKVWTQFKKDLNTTKPLIFVSKYKDAIKKVIHSV